MRVLLAIEEFTPHRGGAERYAVDLARGLVGAGHEVHVAATAFADVPEGVKTIPVLPRSHLKGLRVFEFGRRVARLAGEFDVVHGLVKAWAVDVLHPHTGSHRASLRALRDSHGNRGRAWLAGLLQALSPRQAVYRWIEKRQYRPGRVAVYLAVSRRVADDMKSLHGVPESKIRILHNPVDRDRFRPGDGADRKRIRTRHGIGEGEFLCLFIGHHFRLKGLRPLLEALAKLGPESPHLLALGRETAGRFASASARLGLGDRVTFAGTTAEPEAYYRASDCFVLPTYYDPCSLTVLEAMASGLPVITTRRNGASELMDHGREGYILEAPDRVDDLARHLDDLRDPERRRAMGRRARETAASADPGAHLRSVLDVYRSVVESRAR